MYRQLFYCVTLLIVINSLLIVVFLLIAELFLLIALLLIVAINFSNKKRGRTQYSMHALLCFRQQRSQLNCRRIICYLSIECSSSSFTTRSSSLFPHTPNILFCRVDIESVCESLLSSLHKGLFHFSEVSDFSCWIV